MKINTRAASTSLASLALITLLSGCAIGMKVPVKDPAPSADVSFNKPATAPTAISLGFKDDQSAADKAQLLTGLIPMQIVYQDKPFDAVPWVAQHTVSEMAARGLPVSLAKDAANPSIVIKRVHIENHRVSGFSPFITFTSLRADVMTPKGPQRVTAYVKRGKVPVWSFDEVIDPTYNDPLNIVTKELAAKLNQQLFNQVLADDKVNALIAKIKRGSDDAYLDVYQLGFSNNPVAIPELVNLTAHSGEYIRQAAISSLGILKAADQTDFLIRLYESNDGLWQDRAMALKALGDIGTPRTRAYLQSQLDKLKSRTDKDALWTRQIIELYL